MRAALAVLTTALGLGVGLPAAAAEDPVPLARAHAHNDYEHPRPLEDALDRGFTSVEADVWLVDGELLVAHDLEDVEPGRTLESLYLEPLRERVRANGGSVYPGHDEYVTLLIDVKSEAEATYAAVHAALRPYQGMLTRFTPAGVHAGPVTAVMSGNRARDTMAQQRVRYAAYDGRMDDLGSGAPAAFVPLISANWNHVFTWDGEGPMPTEERELLHRIVAQAHADGQRIRFWATPDAATPAREALWTELLAASVDLINTDDLDGLRDFLLERDPDPSTPSITFGEVRGKR